VSSRVFQQQGIVDLFVHTWWLFDSGFGNIYYFIKSRRGTKT
jgi:hypothetical protein